MRWVKHGVFAVTAICSAWTLWTLGMAGFAMLMAALGVG